MRKKQKSSELDVLVSRLLTLIEGKVSAFKRTADPASTQRQLAAAGLVRCCTLVRAICGLEKVKLSAVVPVLVRLHWETWLVSIYVLLGGEAAMDDLTADDVYWKRKLNEKLELGLPYPRSGWEGKPGKLKFFDLSEKKVNPLLVEAGEPAVAQGPSAYDVMYRVQSTFGAHANLHSLLLHVDLSDEEWPIDLKPASPLSPAAQVPAANTAILARYVFKSFGLPFDRIEAIGESLLALSKDEE